MQSNWKEQLSKFKDAKFSASYIAKIAILTTIAFLLYAFAKFNLPVIFPNFLEIQISELPAILAGFSMGPVSGCLVIIFKCLLKFPLSTTGFVGEATDILLGISYVLPASLIYKHKKDKKHALIGLVVGSLTITVVAIFMNWLVSIPFYITLYFGGDFQALVNVVQPLYKEITQDNFYSYYLLLGVLPFNLLRCIIVSALTFIIYKRLSKVLHWDGHKHTKNVALSDDETDIISDNSNVENLECDDNANCENSALDVAKDMSNNESNDFCKDNLTNDLDDNMKDIQTNNLTGQFVSTSVEDTYSLAQKIASTLVGGEIILLDGDLGAGKTTFTKGLAKALGIDEEVTSPTFTILNIYESGRLRLNHLDMYRVEHEDDLIELGVEEAITDNGITVIEWNKFENLSGRIINIHISSEGENVRVFSIEE